MDGWVKLECCSCGSNVVVPSDEFPPVVDQGDFVRCEFLCPVCKDLDAMFCVEVIAVVCPDCDNGEAQK